MSTERAPASPTSPGDNGSGPQPPAAGVEFDCAICCNVLLDPVVSPCGHDFCQLCLEKWMDQGGETCPVCRARLPDRTSLGVCLRLKAAVEAVAGQLVAARRAELATELAQRQAQRQHERQHERQQERQQERRGTSDETEADAEAQRLAALEERLVAALEEQHEREQHGREQHEREQRDEESVRAHIHLAAGLPVPQSVQPPEVASHPRDRQQEESRWLCYQLGWPSMAAARQAAAPALFAREAALQHQAAHAAAPLWPNPARLRELQAQLEEASVQRQLALVQALPPDMLVPPTSWLPGPPQELSCEESRWRCMHAVSSPWAHEQFATAAAAGMQAATPWAGQQHVGAQLASAHSWR